MKKVMLMLLLAAGAVTTTIETAQAQVGVSFNIGRQPLWGPTGYDYASNYYMPDIDAYYNVDDQQFIYEEDGDWVYGNSLPDRYSNYDLYNGYKVVVNSPRPWMRANYYRSHYAGYRGRRNQSFIRDSRDYRYYENVNHPYHNQWRGARGGNKSNDGYYGGGRNGYNRDGRGNGGFQDRGRGDFNGRRDQNYGRRDQQNGGYQGGRNDFNQGGRGRDFNGRREQQQTGYNRGGGEGRFQRNDQNGSNAHSGGRGYNNGDHHGGNRNGGADRPGGRSYNGGAKSGDRR